MLPPLLLIEGPYVDGGSIESDTTVPVLYKRRRLQSFMSQLVDEYSGRQQRPTSRQALGVCARPIEAEDLTLRGYR